MVLVVVVVADVEECRRMLMCAIVITLMRNQYLLILTPFVYTLFIKLSISISISIESSRDRRISYLI